MNLGTCLQLTQLQNQMDGSYPPAPSRPPPSPAPEQLCNTYIKPKILIHDSMNTSTCSVKICSTSSGFTAVRRCCHGCRAYASLHDSQGFAPTRHGHLAAKHSPHGCAVMRWRILAMRRALWRALLHQPSHGGGGGRNQGE